MSDFDPNDVMVDPSKLSGTQYNNWNATGHPTLYNTSEIYHTLRDGPSKNEPFVPPVFSADLAALGVILLPVIDGIGKVLKAFPKTAFCVCFASIAALGVAHDRDIQNRRDAGQRAVEQKATDIKKQADRTAGVSGMVGHIVAQQKIHVVSYEKDQIILDRLSDFEEGEEFLLPHSFGTVMGKGEGSTVRIHLDAGRFVVEKKAYIWE